MSWGCCWIVASASSPSHRAWPSNYCVGPLTNGAVLKFKNSYFNQSLITKAQLELTDVTQSNIKVVVEPKYEFLFLSSKQRGRVGGIGRRQCQETAPRSSDEQVNRGIHRCLSTRHARAHTHASSFRMAADGFTHSAAHPGYRPDHPQVRQRKTSFWWAEYLAMQNAISKTLSQQTRHLIEAAGTWYYVTPWSNGDDEREGMVIQPSASWRKEVRSTLHSTSSKTFKRSVPYPIRES